MWETIKNLAPGENNLKTSLQVRKTFEDAFRKVYFYSEFAI